MKLIKKYQFGGLTEKLPRAAKTPTDPTLKKMGWDYFHFEDLNPSAQGYSQAKKQHAADPNKVFLVDLKTGRLIPTSEYEANRAMPSEEIDENRTNFEVQQAQNHRDLQNRDPQDLGLALMVTGAAPFLPEVLAPAMPVIKPVLTALNIGIGGYNAAQTVNDIAQGDYEQAAINGTLAATSLAGPYVSALAKYPRLAAALGLGTADAAAYARQTVLDENTERQNEANINHMYENQNHIPTDSEEKGLWAYLSRLGYKIDTPEIPLSDGTFYKQRFITSDPNKNDATNEGSPVWNFITSPGGQSITYFGGRAVVPKVYNKIVKKTPIINWKWVPDKLKAWANNHKGIKNYAKSGMWAMDIPFGLIQVYRQGKEWGFWGDSSNKKEQDPTLLTDAQKKAAANAIKLLMRKYPDLQMSGITPEQQTGVRFTSEDTTDYIPGLPQIEKYISQPQVEPQQVDSSLMNNAPDDM